MILERQRNEGKGWGNEVTVGEPKSEKSFTRMGQQPAI